MKKFFQILCFVMLVAMLLSGCRANVPQDNNGQITPSDDDASTDVSLNQNDQQNSQEQNSSVAILQKIWDQFAEEERFSAFGGDVELGITDAPGSLNVKNVEELTARYQFPESQLSAIDEAASMVHMMNSNLFTTAVVKLSKDADMKQLHEAWRDSIQQTRWIYKQPDKLLLADVDGAHMLMVYGNVDLIKAFSDKLMQQYPEAKILYEQAVVS